MAKDTKDGNNLNEKSYVNKKLLQCYLIISMVLLAAYIMELVKGNRTAGYVFVFSIILIVMDFQCDLFEYVLNYHLAIMLILAVLLIRGFVRMYDVIKHKSDNSMAK